MAAISALYGLMFQPVGRVCGAFYQDLPRIERDDRQRLLGYLDWLEILPARRQIRPRSRSSKGAALSRHAPSATGNR